MAPRSERRAPIARALLSVDDKTGLVELAELLHERGVELWATEGTRRALTERGVPSRAAEELTGIGAWFAGRIKTLHPGILGGVLAPRTPEGIRELEERKLSAIDLVVVNLYPFERHLAERPAAEDREEFIDIGGVTLARAAAKNWRYVAALTDPTQYPGVIDELRTHPEGLSDATRRRLAAAAFERTASYDAAIASGLTSAGPEPFPSHLVFRREPIRLRYGENPHQAAAAYSAVGSGLGGDPLSLVKGEALSFTNLLDLETAVSTVAEFPVPTAVVVKHATPCGVASGETVAEAIGRAVATDPVARYGCAIAVNRPLGAEDPAALKGIFVDLLAAPQFAAGALDRLATRPKIKLVRTPDRTDPVVRWDAHGALGRLLLQQSDRRQLAPTDFRLVAGPPARPEQLCALDFAWRVVRHAKSNAIVLAQGPRTVGIGSGQPTRVRAVEIAVDIAGARARESVLASDAFFPFADGIEIAGKAGVRAILQPGGSLRDPEVIAMAERYGMSMYFTGWRVFRH